MNRKKHLYYGVNLCVAFFSTVFLLKIFIDIFTNQSMNILWDNLYFLLIAFLCACIVYALKALRFYLVLMEKRISAYRFYRVYVKTTLVTIVLPFKLGEVFRAYCYGYEISDYACSILSVLVDRYFDSIPLVALIVATMFLKGNTLSGVVMLLLIFIVLSTLAYCVFPSAQKYFNNFLMANTSSKNGIRMLRILDIANKWYAYVYSLIHGRSLLMLVLSCVAWGAEFISLWCISMAFGNLFGFKEFANYLSTAFLGASGWLSANYLLLGMIIFAVLVMIIYVSSYIKKRSRK
ncbi:MAG: lysylphosphatidylglycerol synthase transmembrane domain-containing protein [Oscillospiraceae bacterium]